MNWYYKVLGSHTHVRVFMNGGKCGDLCFRNEEFNELMDNHQHMKEDSGARAGLINFILDTVTE